MYPKNLDTNIAFVIGEITHLLYLKVTDELRKKQIDITVEQFSILTILFYKDGITQQDIADQLNRDKTTITRVLHNMEKKNLLVRVTDRTDRRNKNIYLTHLGKKLQQKSVTATGPVYLKAIKGLSEMDIQHLIKSLNKIRKNLK